MPICPKCGKRNPESVDLCAQCGARLSEAGQNEEPAGDSAQVDALVELATFHTISEADMVQELLESNGITSVLHGENDPIGSMSGADPITLLVEQKDLPGATELYQAFFSGDQTVSGESTQTNND